MNILQGQKVYLRLVEEKDLPKRVEWINDPEIQHTLTFDYPTSLARTKKWFDNILMDGSRKDFSIFTLENNEYMGFCGLKNIEKPVMKAELYVIIDKKYWGRGYGTDTNKILMNYGFNELGLNKIYAYQLLHNPANYKMKQKLGWKRDGLLRQDVYTHGKIIDHYIFSILREDWEKNLIP